MKLFSENAIKVWNTKDTQIELYPVVGGYRIGIFTGVYTTTYGELSAEITEYRNYKSRNAAMNWIRRNLRKY